MKISIMLYNVPLFIFAICMSDSLATGIISLNQFNLRPATKGMFRKSNSLELKSLVNMVTRLLTWY